MRDTRPCPTCGVLMVRAEKPSAWARRKYCSLACHSEAQAMTWTREEVLRRVSIDEDGCWLWLLSVSQTGYGRLNHRGRTLDAYRFIYELLVGPVPEGLFLDHACHSFSDGCPGGLCKHRLCVNPDHLEPVTHVENMRRSAAMRTTCMKGHPLEQYGWVTASGARRCRICHQARQRAYRRRRREAAA